MPKTADLLEEIAALKAMLIAADARDKRIARLEKLVAAFTATLADTYTHIIAGPQQDDAIPTAQEGLKLSETSPEVQALVLAAIETYVRDVNAVGADAEHVHLTITMPLHELDLAMPDTSGLGPNPAIGPVDGEAKQRIALYLAAHLALVAASGERLDVRLFDTRIERAG